MKNNKGFTLYELVIAISLFTVISGVTTYFIIQLFRANRFADEQNTAIIEAKNGVDTMLKEIREAASAESGDYPIDTADDQSFTFYGDIDLDDVVEKVQYSLSGSDLIKGVIEPSGSPPVYDPSDETTTIISQYIRNGAVPIFTYYNGNWPSDVINNPLSTPADAYSIKLINIFLAVNYNPFIAPGDFTLETNVQIRNLKTNL